MKNRLLFLIIAPIHFLFIMCCTALLLPHWLIWGGIIYEYQVVKNFTNWTYNLPKRQPKITNIKGLLREVIDGRLKSVEIYHTDLKVIEKAIEEIGLKADKSGWHLLYWRTYAYGRYKLSYDFSCYTFSLYK